MELPVLCYEFGILELAGMGSTKTFAVPAVVHRVTVVGQATEEGQASYAAIDRNREIAISFMRQTLQG
jgi:hypothetical protein